MSRLFTQKHYEFFVRFFGTEIAVARAMDADILAPKQTKTAKRIDTIQMLMRLLCSEFERDGVDAHTGKVKFDRVRFVDEIEKRSR